MSSQFGTTYFRWSDASDKLLISLFNSGGLIQADMANAIAVKFPGGRLTEGMVKSRLTILRHENKLKRDVKDIRVRFSVDEEILMQDLMINQRLTPAETAREMSRLTDKRITASMMNAKYLKFRSMGVVPEKSSSPEPTRSEAAWTEEMSHALEILLKNPDPGTTRDDTDVANRLSDMYGEDINADVVRTKISQLSSNPLDREWEEVEKRELLMLTHDREAILEEAQSSLVGTFRKPFPLPSMQAMLCAIGTGNVRVRWTAQENMALATLYWNTPLGQRTRFADLADYMTRVGLGRTFSEVQIAAQVRVLRFPFAPPPEFSDKELHWTEEQKDTLRHFAYDSWSRAISIGDISQAYNDEFTSQVVKIMSDYHDKQLREEVVELVLLTMLQGLVDVAWTTEETRDLREALLKSKATSDDGDNIDGDIIDHLQSTYQKLFPFPVVQKEMVRLRGGS